MRGPGRRAEGVREAGVGGEGDAGVGLAEKRGVVRVGMCNGTVVMAASRIACGVFIEGGVATGARTNAT